MDKQAALGWFQNLGYAVLRSLQLAPWATGSGAGDIRDMVLVGRLRVTIGGLTQLIARLRKQPLHNPQQFNPVAG